MKDLLRLEFRKLRTQKSFYIILAIMFVLVVISALTTKLLENLAAEINEVGEALGGESFNASGESVLLGFVSSSAFLTLTAIFVPIVVCDDYGNSIVKNIVSRGYTRTDFYFAKLIYLIVVTSVMFLVSSAVAAIFGALLFGIGGDTGKIALLIAVQYLACVASVTLYFAISSMIKKLGGAIAICIFAPMILSLVLSLIDSAVNFESFSIADYWLSSFTTSLSDIAVVTKRIIVCAVFSIVYACVFAAVGYAFTNRAEV